MTWQASGFQKFAKNGPFGAFFGSQCWVRLFSVIFKQRDCVSSNCSRRMSIWVVLLGKLAVWSAVVCLLSLSLRKYASSHTQHYHQAVTPTTLHTYGDSWGASWPCNIYRLMLFTCYVKHYEAMTGKVSCSLLSLFQIESFLGFDWMASANA